MERARRLIGTMQHFDAQATRARLPFGLLIPALRAMFIRGCTVPARQVLQPGAGCTSLVMPAWTDGADAEGDHYGVKIVNVAPGNAAHGLPALHASYLLHDANTGVPLALIDGDEITARRTVAASALAASMLARADATHLLVVGAGRLARWLPLAMREVRRIERVSVWARSPQQAQALVDAWRRDGLNAQVAPSLEAAARAADIVSCATLATEPLIHGRWLREGTHLDLIGSFTPQMREADDDCMQGAAVYIDTEEALAKSGDLLGPIARGVFDPAALRGTLTTLCRGAARGRVSGTERTVFKSVGSALEDLAAAMLVFEHQHIDATGTDQRLAGA